jgi:predicted transcriptional regulator
MPDFFDLMFEVSNEERVRILEAIQEERSSFSGLARRLDITTQEVSRHFNRLMEASLTTRDREGYPSLTPFGTLVLKQLEAVQFTNYHRDYFVSHVADKIPRSFVTRFGELAGLKHQDNVMRVITDVIRILDEAEEYVLDVNLPYISSAFPHIRDAYERNIKGKFLHGAGLKLPEEMQGVRDESFTEEFIESLRHREVYEEKYLEVDFVIYMNEKEVAILSFPTTRDDYDFIGFTGSDEEAHQWCKDLFYHYWEQGERIH